MDINPESRHLDDTLYDSGSNAEITSISGESSILDQAYTRRTVLKKMAKGGAAVVAATAIASINPSIVARAEEAARLQNADLKLSVEPALDYESERADIRSINDYTVLADYMGNMSLEPLLDKDMLAFASMVLPLKSKVRKTNMLNREPFQTVIKTKNSNSSVIVVGKRNLGPRNSVYSLFGARHAFDGFRYGSDFPELSIADQKAMGFLISPSEELQTDKYDDLSEMVVIAEDSLSNTNGNEYVDPVLEFFDKDSDFSSLVGKDLFLVGFPGEFYESDSYNRISYRVSIKDFIRDPNDPKKMSFVVSPVDANIPAEHLPGASGGALGYMDENGVPHIIGTNRGYYNSAYTSSDGFKVNNAWIATSLPSDYSTQILNEEKDINELVNCAPTSYGLTEPLFDVQNAEDIYDLNSLVWFMAKNTNINTEELSNMIAFEEKIFNEDLKIVRVRFLGNIPVLFAKNRENSTIAYLWNPNTQTFENSNG